VKKFSLFCLLACLSAFSEAQLLMDMVDTSKEIGRGMLLIYKKFDNVRMGGYMQPQFQYASSKGAKSYNGGDFATNVNNRFMLRRGRIRVDYIHFSESKGPSIQFAFQFDGTERGVAIRDFWGRLHENRLQLFSFTAGMFARPISYELNLSSSDRETPERGRMSQILMKTERDLGAMVSFEPRKPGHPLKFLKLDLGLFNGQGLAATGDFDSHKDIIGRLSIKPLRVTVKSTLSVAVSCLNGGFLQNTKYIYHTSTVGGLKGWTLDSASSNQNRMAPRKYYGADLQYKIKTRAGFTEFRAEYLAGRQTATSASSETPAALLTGSEGYYVRNFNGAYIYLLHHFINSHHQVVLKYDWYDPNSRVSGNEIGKSGSNFNLADIKFSTLSVGYNYYIDNNVKLMIFYDKVSNEKTSLPGYITDIKDDIFTCRLQFRF
jgi:hypothetical protein